MTEAAEPLNILVAMDFSDELIEQIHAVAPHIHVERHARDIPENAWKEAEVLYTGNRFPQPGQAPNLRWVQLHSAGVNHAMQHETLQDKNITITSASGIHATQIANYSMMMILAFQFQLPRMMAYQRQNTWPEKQYEIFRPVDLNKKTVGIVGYGSIGRELARLAQSFGMTVLASKRNLKHLQELDTDYSEGEGDPEGIIPERIYPGEAIATMASASDFLVVTLPLTDATRHTVNAAVFAAMQPSSVVINIGRGAVIDEQAMISALQEGQIAGAGLDVFEEEPLPEDSPLWQMENVLISPHISGNSASYNEKAARLFMANLERYTQKKPLMNVVNRETGY